MQEITSAVGDNISWAVAENPIIYTIFWKSVMRSFRFTSLITMKCVYFLLISA